MPQLRRIPPGACLLGLIAVLACVFIPAFSQDAAGARRVRLAHAPALVSDDVLTRADEYASDWLMYAKNYRGHRFSPLDEINRDSVRRLVPKWCFSTGTHGGQQCTPLVHRGVMYVTSTRGRISAIDAASGDLLWDFDSRLPDDVNRYAATDANRGAALYRDRVIWSNLIGRIFAHDAKTGKVLWQVTPDYYRLGYVKTLAPLVVKGKVITGTSGGEFGTRGFVEARDAETGKRVWKTYTIPGPGEPGHETWPDNDAWEHGGAPTWITGSYDPQLNLIYWATGNGAPWSAEERPGDNLYCCCILALDADTGRIRWHFQFVPNDDWDYDCNVTPVLAEIEHEGKSTPVLAMAVKNGFLYVLDRRNGKFLKATPVAETLTWAKGLNPAGRPIENSGARPPRGSTKRVFVAPSALGTVNWWGSAFDPGRQWLVLIANETGMSHVWDPIPYVPGEQFIGSQGDEFPQGMRRTAERPGRVCAWDLRTLKKQWEAERELEVRWGGPLVTGGGLVFTGTLRGILQALDAGTGRRLWQFQTGSGIMAHPVTYQVEGRQYVAIVSGKGGVTNPASLSPELFKHQKNHNSSGMVFAFGLP